MPEVYVGWPQRRDFPIGGEPVIFTYNERRSRGGRSERAPIDINPRAGARPAAT